MNYRSCGNKNWNVHIFSLCRFQVMPNGTLFISQVSKDDDGQYGCTAGNSGGFKREEVRLFVKSGWLHLLRAFTIGFWDVESTYLFVCLLADNHEFYTDSLNEAVMTKTVSITLSVAAGYMLLVVGLMLWCRYRQLKRKQAYLAESK